jgi:hypothetical protein
MNGQSKLKATSGPIPTRVAGGKQKQLGDDDDGTEHSSNSRSNHANNTRLLVFANLAWLAI